MEHSGLEPLTSCVPRLNSKFYQLSYSCINVVIPTVKAYVYYVDI